MNEGKTREGERVIGRAGEHKQKELARQRSGTEEGNDEQQAQSSAPAG